MQSMLSFPRSIVQALKLRIAQSHRQHHHQACDNCYIFLCTAAETCWTSDLHIGCQAGTAGLLRISSPDQDRLNLPQSPSHPFRHSRTVVRHVHNVVHVLMYVLNWLTLRLLHEYDDRVSYRASRSGMTFLTFWASSQLLKSAKCVMNRTTHVVVGSACRWYQVLSALCQFCGAWRACTGIGDPRRRASGYALLNDYSAYFP